jgi:hypothetical protein
LSCSLLRGYSFEAPLPSRAFQTPSESAAPEQFVRIVPKALAFDDSNIIHHFTTLTINNNLLKRPSLPSLRRL